ncbi:MAG: hypothetical protein PHV51_01945 [Methanosarcinaceae archaeon]|nr:hypothetical protein [Methanosarcinaceae archaeon]MDD4496906.1 hypothetical protein [Methanosarcinaceae archaeon]
MEKLAKAKTGLQENCLQEKDSFLREIAADTEKEQIFQVAADLNLFSKLTRAQSAEELAGELGTKPELTARFLDVLVSLEGLVKKDGVYFTAPMLASFLGRQDATPSRRPSRLSRHG